MGTIEPEYITGIYVFEDDCDQVFVSQLENLNPEIDITVDFCPDDFLKRCYMEKDFWENTKRDYMAF